MPEPNPPVAYRHPVRVYWEDTDAGGIVFYANYLKFFERARTEWLRCLGLSQQRLQTEQGVIFVVAETSLRHLRVVAEADDGDAARRLIAAHQPDVAVLDIQMPRATGIEVARWSRAAHPTVGVLILTSIGAKDFLPPPRI